MRQIFILAVLAFMPLLCAAQKVSVRAESRPAAAVFRSLMDQTGMNFVYSSDLLKDVRVTVNAKNKPLKKVLSDIFRHTDIEYAIRGNNVILKRKKVTKTKSAPVPKPKTVPRQRLLLDTVMSAIPLDEIVVVSRLEAPVLETSEIGAMKLSADQVREAPVLFGESDVIKALHSQPGVAEGTEGMAGMHVHGGEVDENLYMLDNVPLYQVNHFAGLFSAFNTEVIRYADFFKSSVPARYDGRLSSFLDVRTMSAGTDGHHGSARLGLTSGALGISGPIGDKTSYMVGLRRSWYDVLTIPAVALVNASTPDEKLRLRYKFMDLNARVNHRFNPDMNLFVSAYFGDDMLKTGLDDKHDGDWGWQENEKFDFRWGNLVVQAGLDWRIDSSLKAEMTAAYTRYFSDMKHDDIVKERTPDETSMTRTLIKTDNNINDWIFRGDFCWLPAESHKVRFGAGYVRHSFLPSRTSREYTFGDTKEFSRDSTWAYGAHEFDVYAEDDWAITRSLRVNAGIHASLFHIDGKTRHGLSPRLSFSWHPADSWAFKAAYSRTVQYVHQLSQSYLALPTDQWIPVIGRFKPQTADKVCVGGYWQTSAGSYAVSLEGYYKWMHHLIDYCDEYYLKPPLEMWDARLTSGSGTAKGLDLKVEKRDGKLTGHISYSLAWADRTFSEKNGGKAYPARFDNRHTVNVSVGWAVSDKVKLNAAWTGHSGNRFTFMPQVWDTPGFGNQPGYDGDEVPLRTSLNNYRLPFYHRLDLSCTVRNSRGYWTFGLYNAYCHMNTIAVRRAHKELLEQTPEGLYYKSVPVFQKVSLLPIIPSISYTWLF